MGGERCRNYFYIMLILIVKKEYVRLIWEGSIVVFVRIINWLGGTGGEREFEFR